MRRINAELSSCSLFLFMKMYFSLYDWYTTHNSLKSPNPTINITQPCSGDFWGVVLPLHGPDPKKNLICIYHHVCEIEFQIHAAWKQSISKHNRDEHHIPPLRQAPPLLALFSIYSRVPSVLPGTHASGNSCSTLPLNAIHPDTSKTPVNLPSELSRPPTASSCLS